MTEVIQQRASFYMEQIVSLLKQAAADGISIDILHDYIQPNPNEVTHNEGFSGMHHNEFVAKVDFLENNLLHQGRTHVMARMDILHNTDVSGEQTDHHVYIGANCKPIPLTDYVGILNRPVYFNKAIGQLIAKARDEGVGVYFDQPEPPHSEEPLVDMIDFKGYTGIKVVCTQSEFAFSATHPLLGHKAMLKCFSIQGDKETPTGNETWTYIGMGYPALKTK